MILQNFDIQAKRSELTEKLDFLKTEQSAIEDSLLKIRHRIALIKRSQEVLIGIEEMLKTETTNG